MPELFKIQEGDQCCWREVEGEEEALKRREELQEIRSNIPGSNG